MWDKHHFPSDSNKKKSISKSHVNILCLWFIYLCRLWVCLTVLLCIRLSDSGTIGIEFMFHSFVLQKHLFDLYENLWGQPSKHGFDRKKLFMCISSATANKDFFVANFTNFLFLGLFAVSNLLMRTLDV